MKHRGAPDSWHAAAPGDHRQEREDRQEHEERLGQHRVDLSIELIVVDGSPQQPVASEHARRHAAFNLFQGLGCRVLLPSGLVIVISAMSLPERLLMAWASGLLTKNARLQMRYRRRGCSHRARLPARKSSVRAPGFKNSVLSVPGILPSHCASSAVSRARTRAAWDRYHASSARSRRSTAHSGDGRSSGRLPSGIRSWRIAEPDPTAQRGDTNLECPRSSRSPRSSEPHHQALPRVGHIPRRPFRQQLNLERPLGDEFVAPRGPPGSSVSCLAPSFHAIRVQILGLSGTPG